MNRREFLRNGAVGIAMALVPSGPTLRADSGDWPVQAPTTGSVGTEPTHPLDPLTAAEIATAVSAVKASGRLAEGALFATVVLQEPPKEAVLAFGPGDPLQRQAFIVVFDRQSNRTSEAGVDLATAQLVSWQDRPNAQPHLLKDDMDLVERLVRADPQWQAAMQARGITDPDNVVFDTWGVGDLPTPAAPGTRLSRTIFFYRGGATNAYARPVEGVVAVVDLTRSQVIQIVDTGVVPLAAPDDLDAASLSPLRDRSAPVQTILPDGHGFDLQDNAVSWQNWRFRLGLHPREGLVLYTVGYQDHDRLRSILYRAALSEMVVPYADPDSTWAWRSAFDEGEYGMGRLTNSLTAGVEVPSHAAFVDAVFADDLGRAYGLPRAVALYERDGGVLWQHRNEELGRSEVRRARELVLHTQVTVGNYDYGFDWIFRQDGSLELEAQLTGILLAKGVGTGADTDGIATPIGQYVAAPNHQHFFNFRLDFDIDGTANSVVETNTRGLPAGSANPYGNAFAAEETILRHEREARRELDDAANRSWKVINPTETNSLGLHPGYMLVPGENAVPYIRPETATRQRAGFLDYHLWVTRYNPAELYAAGDYPNQAPAGDGLPAWTDQDEAIEGTDVVVWYTFGLTHIPRPEDWPVVPMERLGFRLTPFGFFTQNPTLDVPPPVPEAR